MTTPLVEPSDLDEYPGAPFSVQAVDSAAARVRGEAGWHIAPVVTETLTVETHHWTQRLILPTLRLLDVTAVRDITDPTVAPVAVDDWRFLPNGILVRRRSYWPCGVLEVDVQHGYAECPAELLPVIAAYCQSGAQDRSIASQTTGPFSVSYRDSTATSDPALSRLTIPARP